MISGDSGRVKLADFGIASSLSDTMSRMTRSGAGAGAGTLVYMSPQQLMGYPPSVSDDVYALGATIYELLTGKPPFFRGSIERQIESVVPPSMAERRAELEIGGTEPVPALWEEVIATCLEKEADKRPQSVAEVWQRLSVSSGYESPMAGVEEVNISVQAHDEAELGSMNFIKKDRVAVAGIKGQNQPNRILLLVVALLVVAVALVWWFGESATMKKETPLVNSLGMKFVAVPGTQVMICVHETRNMDYAAYAAAQNGVDEDWKEEAGSGKDHHPVINVSYDDAEGFCRWLSAKEGKTYRLPTDAEWSTAVGLTNEKGQTPAEKYDYGVEDVFPWGNYYPPKPFDGNYCKELLDEGTLPVMSLSANEFGIYDLGGNVWEWCRDWYDDSQEIRVLRGASWHDGDRVTLRSSFRIFDHPSGRLRNYGFRCALVVSGS
jgi:formylglycine-generating enzyme required for sulfatase activity